MLIRKATINDLSQLTVLFEAYRKFYRKAPDFEGAQSFLLQRIENQDSEIFVADLNNELMGFVQLYSLFTSTNMKKSWLLNDLYVSSVYRGSGVSVKLIEKAKELVKMTQAYGMYLETEKSNVIGNQLYPKTGFVLNDLSNYYEWTV